MLEGLISAFKYDKTYFDKIVSSVVPLMEKLTTGSIAALISPDCLDEEDTRPIFEWKEVIQRKGIVYVGLDALTDTTVASAVGNSMFADLISVAGFLYKNGLETSAAQAQRSRSRMPTISLHVDEFNELIGGDFVPLLSKAGGAGFQVTSYTQTWSDLEARIGSRARKRRCRRGGVTMVEATDPRRPVSSPSTWYRCLSGVGHALKWLVISLVFSIVNEWVGMIL